MNISLVSLLPLVSTIFVFGLGVFVFFKNPKSKLNIVFALIAVTVTIWLFGTFMMFNSGTDKQAIFWDRFIYMGVVFVPALMYHFSIIFSNRRGRRKLLILSYILSCIFLILSRTEYFVSDLFKYSWGVHTQAKFFHHVFLVNFFYFLALTLRNFYQYYRNKSLSGLEKARAKYVFFAFFILITVGSTAYAPAYQIGIYPFSFASGLVFTIILAYAITRYRLMDVRFVFGRGAVYGLSLITIVAFAFLLMFLGNQFLTAVPFNIIAILVLIISVLLFQSIFRFFEKIASKFFYYTFYNYQRVLTDLGRGLTQVLDLDKLSLLIVNTLIDTMKLDRTVVLMREPGNGDYLIQKNIGFREENGISLVKDNYLTVWLEKNQTPLVYEELSLMIHDTAQKKEKEKMEKLRINMKRIEAAFCLPLLMEEKIIGMIVLGNKISGDPYSEQDIGLLTNLANQASVALQNAKLYQQVEDFSQNLQKKVDEQTGELRKAYEELKVLDKAKSEFISMASHQLRTPLSAIKGYISMLIEGSYGRIPEKAREKLSSVFQSNERLIKIVNELLNISKIELGKIEVEKSPAQLEELIRSCFEEMKIEAEKKRIKIIFEKPKVPLPQIKIDQLKIRQVILNLIDNAIRYTQKGKIELKTEKVGLAIRFSVRDTGEGLTEKEQKEIFTGFVRGSAGINYFIEGAGLGLYVAKKFLELHQGRIWAESKGKGKGSTFYIELPIKT